MTERRRPARLTRTLIWLGSAATVTGLSAGLMREAIPSAADTEIVQPASPAAQTQPAGREPVVAPAPAPAVHATTGGSN